MAGKSSSTCAASARRISKPAEQASDSGSLRLEWVGPDQPDLRNNPLGVQVLLRFFRNTEPMMAELRAKRARALAEQEAAS